MQVQTASIAMPVWSESCCNGSANSCASFPVMLRYGRWRCSANPGWRTGCSHQRLRSNETRIIEHYENEVERLLPGALIGKGAREYYLYSPCKAVQSRFLQLLGCAAEPVSVSAAI